MGKSQLFYDRHQIGTHLVGIPEALSRGGAGIVIGLDREFAIAEHLNSNFESHLTALVGFHNPVWTQRTFNKEIYRLNREMRRFAQEHGRGWLSWVNSEDETTTTVNGETAGSNVQIEVVNVGLLNLHVGDYVLVFPPESLSPPDDVEDLAQVLEVTNVGAGDFTVATLGADLPSGSTVYRVWAAWENAVFVSCDTGQPPEQSADFYRFVTSWEFVAPKDPVLSAVE